MDFKALAKVIGLDEEEYLDYIKLFIEVSKSDLDNLLRAIEEGCAEKVAAAAHSIRGASGNLGLIKLHETAEQIEEKGRQCILEGVVELAHLLTEELKRLEKIVESKP
jgi:HPt (histidine-containing phosphotransfer) domain-containing protein